MTKFINRQLPFVLAGILMAGVTFADPCDNATITVINSTGSPLPIKSIAVDSPGKLNLSTGAVSAGGSIPANGSGVYTIPAGQSPTEGTIYFGGQSNTANGWFNFNNTMFGSCDIFGPDGNSDSTYKVQAANSGGSAHAMSFTVTLK